MIRKLLFLILSVFMSSGLSAQQNLLQADRLWSMVEVHCLPAGNTYTSHFLKAGNDTTINGETYSILRYSQDETQQEWFDYGGFIRETPDGKVYYTRSGLEEGLIYDFGATLGDTVEVLNHELIPETLYMAVILEDSILLEDGWHRMLVLEDENFPGEETWIEGVGSVSGLVKSCLNAFGSACGDFDLLCSSDSGQEIYINPEYPACWYVSTRIGSLEVQNEIYLYPNPVRDILHIDGAFSETKQFYDIQIFDHSGRMVLQEENNARSIDLGNLGSGLYLIRVQTASEIYTGRLVKE